jgi:HEAT repeat protein
MMPMTRRRCLWLCLVMLLVALLLLPAVHWRLIGWVKGEAFYQGRPTSYWRIELEQWDPYAHGSSYEPSWLEKNLPKPISSFLGKPVWPLQNVDPEATGVLIELMADEDQKIRGSAFYGLRRIGPRAQAATPALARMLHDPVRRWHAATVMADIGVVNDDLIQMFVTGLNQKEDPGIRYGVALNLAKLGEKATPALPQIIETLLSDDITLVKDKNGEEAASWCVRDQLVIAIGQMQGQAKVVVPVLLAVAVNEKANQGVHDNQLRCRALQALSDFGEAARPALPGLRKLKKEGSNGAIHFDLEKAILVIEGVEPDATLHTIDKLSLRGRAAVPELQQFLDHENRHVRAAAERAINTCTQSKR